MLLKRRELSRDIWKELELPKLQFTWNVSLLFLQYVGHICIR